MDWLEKRDRIEFVDIDRDDASCPLGLAAKNLVVLWLLEWACRAFLVFRPAVQRVRAVIRFEVEQVVFGQA